MSVMFFNLLKLDTEVLPDNGQIMQLLKALLEEQRASNKTIIQLIQDLPAKQELLVSEMASDMIVAGQLDGDKMPESMAAKSKLYFFRQHNKSSRNVIL